MVATIHDGTKSGARAASRRNGERSAVPKGLSMKDSRQPTQARSRRSLAGLLAGLMLLPVTFAAATAEAVVTLRVMTSDAVPGGTLPLIVRMDRDSGDSSVASTQVDLIYQTEQLALPGSCSGDGAACTTHEECGTGRCELLCEKDVRLTQQDFNATFPEFQNVEPGQRRVRLRLLAPIQVTLPLPTFEDGILAMCMFDIPTSAPLGPIVLSGTRLEVGDEESNQVEAVVVIEAGSIVSELPTLTPTPTTEPSATATATEADSTPTPSVTATPQPPTATATTTIPTLTPTPFSPTATATPVLTATAVPPTATEVAPTATIPPTTSVPTSTATAVRTPTVVQTATPGSTKRNDDDGCAIVEPNSAGSARGLLWLSLPLAVLLGVGRRRGRQA